MFNSFLNWFCLGSLMFFLSMLLVRFILAINTFSFILISNSNHSLYIWKHRIVCYWINSLINSCYLDLQVCKIDVLFRLLTSSICCFLIADSVFFFFLFVKRVFCVTRKLSKYIVFSAPHCKQYFIS